MNLFWAIVLVAIGLLLIIKGGDFFVDSASWIAEISGIPKLIVGATVVSFATTLPELLVSLISVFNGSNNMAIGNAVGSVTANIGLIMAISIICIPAIIKNSEFWFKGLAMITAGALLFICSLGGSFSWWGAIILLILFAMFMWENLSAIKKSKNSIGELNKDVKIEEKPKKDKKTIWKNVLKFIFGLAGIIGGAELMVTYGQFIARTAGVSENIIALTLLAVGTSLPELVTTITAIAKKESSLSVGNIIGANVIDLTIILPLCTIFSGKAVKVDPQSLYINIPMCVLLGIVAVVPTLIQKRFRRWQGITLLVLYLTYMILTCVGVLNV